MSTADELLAPVELGFGRSVTVALVRGRVVAALGQLDGSLLVVDATTGRPVGPPLAGHSGPVLALATGSVAGGPAAVSGGEDGSVMVWDLGDGDCVLRLEAEDLADGEGMRGTAVSAVAFGLVGGREVVVAGRGDATVRAWDLGTGAPLAGPLRLPEGIAGDASGRRSVLAVAVFEQAGRATVTAAGRSGAATAWDAGTGESLVEVPLVSPALHAAAFGVIRELGDRPVWFLGEGELAEQHGAAAGSIWMVDAGSPDWSADGGFEEPLRLDGAPAGLAFGYVGEHPVVAASSAGNSVYLFDLWDDGQRRLELPAEVLVDAVVVGPDRHLLAGAGGRWRSMLVPD